MDDPRLKMLAEQLMRSGGMWNRMGQQQPIISPVAPQATVTPTAPVPPPITAADFMRGANDPTIKNARKPQITPPEGMTPTNVGGMAPNPPEATTLAPLPEKFIGPAPGTAVANASPMQGTPDPNLLARLLQGLRNPQRPNLPGQMAMGDYLPQ